MFVKNDLFIFSSLNQGKKPMKNFKEEFVNYQNDLIQNNQQRIELLFELNEFFVTTKLMFGQKHRGF